MRHTQLAIACSVILVAAASAQFTDASYTEAFDRAVKEDKVFLVHATAVWCGPCKMMDRDTYSEESVQEWLRANAIAVKVDVDEQPDRAEELGIRAMPTMVVFKGGEEFDRVTGYRGPDDFLGWLEDVKAGRSTLDALRESAGDRPMDAGGRVDIFGRMEIAQQLVEAREFDAALEEYLWLWNNAGNHDEYFEDSRGALLGYEIGVLSSRYPKAKEAFAAICDEIEEQLREQPTWSELGDWLALNIEVLERSAPVLAWVDRNIEDEEGQRSLRRFFGQLQPFLIEHGRWRDTGRLISRPEATVRSTRGMLNMMGSAMSHSDLENLPEEYDPMAYFHTESELELSQTVFALIAAGRIEEAAATANLAAELLPELDITERLMEFFDEHTEIRDDAKRAFAGREDLPDAVAEAIN